MDQSCLLFSTIHKILSANNPIQSVKSLRDRWVYRHRFGLETCNNFICSMRIKQLISLQPENRERAIISRRNDHRHARLHVKFGTRPCIGREKDKIKIDAECSFQIDLCRSPCNLCFVLVCFMLNSALSTKSRQGEENKRRN